MINRNLSYFIVLLISFSATASDFNGARWGASIERLYPKEHHVPAPSQPKDLYWSEPLILGAETKKINKADINPALAEMAPAIRMDSLVSIGKSKLIWNRDGSTVTTVQNFHVDTQNYHYFSGNSGEFYSYLFDGLALRIAPRYISLGKDGPEFIIYHSHLTANGLAASAGEIQIDKDGKIIFLSNRSGHFQTSGTQFALFVDFLNQQNVFSDQISFEYWEKKPGLEILDLTDRATAKIYVASKDKSKSLNDLLKESTVFKENRDFSSLTKISLSAQNEHLDILNFNPKNLSKKQLKDLFEHMISRDKDSQVKNFIQYFAHEDIIKNDTIELAIQHRSTKSLAIILDYVKCADLYNRVKHLINNFGHKKNPASLGCIQLLIKKFKNELLQDEDFMFFRLSDNDKTTLNLILDTLKEVDLSQHFEKFSKRMWSYGGTYQEIKDLEFWFFYDRQAISRLGYLVHELEYSSNSKEDQEKLTISYNVLAKNIISILEMFVNAIERSYHNPELSSLRDNYLKMLAHLFNETISIEPSPLSALVGHWRLSDEISRQAIRQDNVKALAYMSRLRDLKEAYSAVEHFTYSNGIFNQVQSPLCRASWGYSGDLGLVETDNQTFKKALFAAYTNMLANYARWNSKQEISVRLHNHNFSYEITDASGRADIMLSEHMLSSLLFRGDRLTDYRMQNYAMHEGQVDEYLDRLSKQAKDYLLAIKSNLSLLPANYSFNRNIDLENHWAFGVFPSILQLRGNIASGYGSGIYELPKFVSGNGFRVAVNINTVNEALKALESGENHPLLLALGALPGRVKARYTRW